MRATFIRYSKVVSQGSTMPESGAADCGSGVHASGMWPSPVSSPEVASSPIHPAPGRYTSHQACRSVKSWLGPGRPLERLQVRDELDEIAGNEACGETEMAQELHQEFRRIAA